jgi:hypothetical protein
METVRRESARRVLVSVLETVVFADVIGDVDAPVAGGTLREQGLKGGRSDEVEEDEEEENLDCREKDGRRDGSVDDAVIVVVVVDRVA